MARHLRGDSTSGLMAATFDDGYAALQDDFKRFIESHAIPIAIFVVAGAAETGARYWWDRLDYLFPRTSPDRWRIFEDACGLPDAYRAGQPAEYGPLRPLRQWILARHAGRWPHALDGELDSLEREAGGTTPQRAMTFAELSDFTALRHVEIGVHTASHPVLPLLSDVELQREITGTWRRLREHFDEVLPVLAMPFGLYDERTCRLAAAAGMTAVLTLSGEMLGGHVPANVVPRICVTRSDAGLKLSLRLRGLPQAVRAWRGRAAPLYPALPSSTS